jgi:hypothetical protein
MTFNRTADHFGESVEGPQPTLSWRDMQPSFVVSVVCHAFDNVAIGSRVTDRGAFMEALIAAVVSHDTSKDRAPGQHFIVLPETTFSSVSSGEGKRTANVGDYVLRIHRGVVGPYLKRDLASPIKTLAVVVYTVEAYLADPEINEVPGKKEQIESARDQGATHVIVAVIAAAAPRAPRTPYRFTAALAGGNNEADTWSLEEVRRMASESISYWDEWAIVAD